jgi:UDP-N-acetylmuramyl pentapeptide phosphotransferase/UDP-N-acetylglucosamine-1-phosphate transferase
VSLVVALVLGLAATVLLERTTRPTFAQPILDRENHRGHHLPTASGLLLVAAVIAVEGVRTLLGVAGLDTELSTPSAAMLVVVVAFGFLGLVDDLLGDAHDRGLRGHVGAAVRGRVTTGFLKLGGGAAVALVLARSLDGDRPARVIVDAALISLAANIGNLFDRAPGRTLKVGLIAAVPLLVVAGTSAEGVALAVVVGAALGLLPGDLAERSMMGDTGANALGAALGLATVLTGSFGVRIAVAVVLLALTLVSEVVSFTRVINAVPPLRALDRLGRRP